MIDLKANIELLKNSKVEDVINSDLVIILLRTYSALFEGGGQLPWCAKCHRRYYTEIVNNGLTQLEKMKEYQNRICVPNWEGLMYIHKTGRHYSNLFITDKEAIYLLENELIKESSFKVLPYPVKEVIVEIEQENIIETLEIAQLNLLNSENSPILPTEKKPFPRRNKNR